jgi:hypothetical protein
MRPARKLVVAVGVFISVCSSLSNLKAALTPVAIVHSVALLPLDL